MNTHNDERNALVLGALLHDIGKFYQRAGLPAEGYEGFSAEDYGRNGAHAKWSASFVAQYVPERWRGAASPAFYHHNPKDPLHELVAKADALSSGIDRERRGEERGDTEFDRQACVLEQVAIPKSTEEQREAKKREYTYPLKPLSLREDAIFSQRFPKESLKGAYHDLWKQFVAEVELIKVITDFNAYLESLYYLLWKYTWCVPSAVYVDYPDIPLFDHLRATAAIATCLYDTDGEATFRLVEGDLSGIQDFIYGTASPNEAQRGMAKRLRGKSFYLSLLTRTLTDYFVTSLELPMANVLWQGGGHFAILAPDNSKTEDRLNAALNAVETFLWEEFQGGIALVVGDARADGRELRDFGGVVSRIGQELARLKTQKQGFLLSKQEAWQFPFRGAVCPLCQRDVERLEEDACDQCRRFEQIGGALPRTNWLIRLRDVEGELPDDGRTVAFKPLGVHWRLDETGHGEVPEGAAGVGIFALSGTGDSEQGFQFLHSRLIPSFAYGFEIIANIVKKDDDGRILEFDELADLSPGKFLGTLRMDVDDLGAVFALGFDAKDRSLSRITNMSRSLDLFFSGYMNRLADGRNVYVAYAGGDDLFITGAWNEVVELASHIQEKFRDYCANNPDLHISAGVYLSKGKYPIGRAAEYAGDRLDNTAKSDDKNALALFERRVPWERFREIKKLADEKLIPAIQRGDVSRRFFYFLLSLYRQHIDPDRRTPGRTEKGEELVWVPKLLYSLARNVEDKALCLELQQEVMRLKEHIPILVGYVGLMTREM